MSEIRESEAPFRLISIRAIRGADAQGFVRLPNVDLVKEMADMISAVRSYEANLNAFNLTKEMANRTVELWR